MAPVEVNVCANEAEVISSLSKLIESKAVESINKNNHFRVGLSGGSLIKFLCKGLPTINTDWTKWKFFFCDERLVPFDNKESTFGCYKQDLMPLLPITESQFVTINPNLKGEEAAEDYARKIEQELRISSSFPKFDLLLLGMGPDGHTCSLFPNHPLLKKRQTQLLEFLRQKFFFGQHAGKLGRREIMIFTHNSAPEKPVTSEGEN